MIADLRAQVNYHGRRRAWLRQSRWSDSLCRFVVGALAPMGALKARPLAEYALLARRTPSLLCPCPLPADVRDLDSDDPDGPLVLLDEHLAFLGVCR